MFKDPENSAEMVTFLATSPVLSRITGQYFANYQISRYPKILEDSQYCKRVWEQAADLVSLEDEEKQTFCL